MDLTTPAVLFPAISLLLLAYTNRFLALAALIRSLHDKHRQAPDERLVAQLGNLRYRVLLIRNMQALGVLSLLLCTFCVFLLFIEQVQIAKVTFGISLALMVGSLGLSLWEIQISVNALNVQLEDLEQDHAADEPGSAA
jgi:hypothetical protein